MPEKPTLEFDPMFRAACCSRGRRSESSSARSGWMRRKASAYAR
jgi:hypothetical protein